MHECLSQVPESSFEVFEVSAPWPVSTPVSTHLATAAVDVNGSVILLEMKLRLSTASIDATYHSVEDATDKIVSMVKAPQFPVLVAFVVSGNSTSR